MLFGKRLFPYPVLNADKSLSQFPRSIFSGVYEIESDDVNLVFKNAHYELSNKFIANLIRTNAARCVLYVECPSTRFRKLFTLTSNPADIAIPLYQLNGQLQICAYIYANENINPYCPDGIDDIYGSFRNFEVEKYDILAIDECERFRVSFDVDDDNLSTSIFLVIGDPELLGDKIVVHCTERKIEVSVSVEVYQWYSAIKGIHEYKWIPFSLLLVAGLMQAFEQIKTDKSIESIEDVERNYQWFMSVETRFEKTFNRKLTYEEFMELSSLDVAQQLLDTPCGKAMKNSFDLITSGGNIDD